MASVITLTFSDIVGTDLINADRFSLSDPYCIVTAPDGVEIVKTAYLPNEMTEAIWAGPFEATVGELSGTFKVAIVDNDRGPDDPMGHVDITIPAENGEHALSNLTLTGVEGVEQSRLALKVTVAGIVPQPTAPEPKPEPSASPAPTAPPTDWTKAELPKKAVVRKEIRTMSEAEQERIYRGFLKMRENKTDPRTGQPIKASSEWCRLASYHGGFPGVPSLPSYCSHGRENFPNWHRPYLIDFEQMLRRADMALGNDGDIGLPYWGWEDLRAGAGSEVLPAMIRRMCDEIDNETWAKMQANDPTALDFYPGPWENRDGHYWLGYRRNGRTESFERIPDDEGLARLLDSAGVVEQAERSLHMSMHRVHASSTYARGRAAMSIEQPHGTVHVHCGDVMRSHRSSFHPVFWMHHANIDRYYQSYLEDEGYDNSKREFQRNQRRRPTRPDPGYPDGPWGRLEPFHSNGGVPGTTTEATMAPTETMGYVYDSLPKKETGRQMREAPYYACFESVRVATLERPCAVFVYLYDKTAGEPWAPPIECTTDEELTRAPGFAGSGSIFFFALNDAPCENCVGREPFDVRVDVTAALRSANLHPKRAGLGVMVSDDGGRGITPIEQTKVPIPTLRGPHFFTKDNSIHEGNDDDDDDAVVGLLGSKGADAVKAFQKAAGLVEDGVVGPITKRRLAVGNLTKDGGHEGVKGGGIKAKRGQTVGWWLDADSVPTDLPIDKVEKELAKAFDQWAKPTGIKFVQKDAKKDAKIFLDFDDRSPKNDSLFDGPGGALAEASANSITFDESERWCLSGGDEKKRPPFTWDDQEFELLTIATHEIGHLLGLKHSHAVEDVMNAFYVPGRWQLSENDVQCCLACMPGGGGGKEGKSGGGGSSACMVL